MNSNYSLEEAILDTELRHINFFNGRLLSGEDLSAERDATHGHVHCLGRAVGAGVACGLEVESAQGSPPSDVEVKIKAGLALNKEGQTLRLACDQLVSLVRPPDPAKRADCVFSDCGPFAAGSTLTGDGYYLLTIAPASEREGLAPVSGLGNSPAACNSRYFTEGVQFRLLPMSVAAPSDAAHSRNEVAYQCFGLPPLGPSDFARAALAPGALPTYGFEPHAPGLTEADVALAVIEWKAGDGIGVIDLWPVRRRITRPIAGGVWSPFTDDRRRAEAEATLLQFQDHVAAILDEPGVAPAFKAETRFQFLPPAGFLKVGGANFTWKTFLGAHAPQSATPLDDGLVRSILYHSLGQEPVRVVAASAASTAQPPPVGFHVYQVPSRSDYVLFTRSSLGEVLAEDVLFDNSRCKLPGVETVQEAIEALCEAWRGCCTLVVRPEPDWEKIFDRIQAGQDAEICFQAGTFSVAKPPVIAGKGHLRLVGCGRATRIVCSGGESALQFENCASVSVSHLCAESGAITRGKPTGQHLNGALSFLNCPVVEVERVVATCPAGTTRMAACLAVRNDVGAPGSARVCQSQFEVGHEQTGILLVNTVRAHIEDNVLRAGAAISWQRLVDDLGFRARLRRHLISHISSQPGGGLRNASVNVAGHSVAFRSPASLVATWQPAVAAMGGVVTPQRVGMALRSIADRVLLEEKVPGVSPGILNTIFGPLAERTAATASQGIVVAGRAAADIRVLHNTLADFKQAIHIGVSHSDKQRLEPDRAGTVWILNNTVGVRLAAGSTRDRHGILVGNCDTLVIERNYVTLTRATAAADLPIQGLRIFGSFGRRILVRENHLAPVAGVRAFDVGIRFHALNAPTVAGTRIWIIDNNVFESSPKRFDIAAVQQPILRGLDTNIA